MARVRRDERAHRLVPQVGGKIPEPQMKCVIASAMDGETQVASSAHGLLQDFGNNEARAWRMSRRTDTA